MENNHFFLFNLKRLSLLLILISPVLGNAQLSLEEALSNAKTKAPIAQLKAIAATESGLKTANLSKKNYPQFSLMGQATYQSDVTSVPIELPGIDIPSAPKDQYKLQVEANQNLYDGGAVKHLKAINLLNQKIEVAQVDVQLEAIERRVIESFFSILEIDARLDILALKRTDIEANLKRVDNAVTNGALLKTEAYALQAALLNLDQSEIELKSFRKVQFEVLNLLMGTSYDETPQLIQPDNIEIEVDGQSQSANDYLLNLKASTIDQQEEMDKIAARPKANVFLQGGFGRPALNFLSDEFEPYYIAGIRFKWDLNKFYTNNNDRALRSIGKEKIEIIRQVNHLQTNIQLSQEQANLDRLQLTISKDDELFTLRENIRKIAQVQLENGILTSAEYLIKLNEQNQSALNKVLHELQWKKANYLYAHINGQI